MLGGVKVVDVALDSKTQCQLPLLRSNWVCGTWLFGLNDFLLTIANRVNMNSAR